MTQNWTKKILKKWSWLKISQKYGKDIINGYVYVEKFS
jgi:hypothetical protein